MKTHQRDTGCKNSQSQDAREKKDKIDGFLDSYNNIILVLLIVIILIIIYINVIK
jgi:hypothetical protein